MTNIAARCTSGRSRRPSVQVAENLAARRLEDAATGCLDELFARHDAEGKGLSLPQLAALMEEYSGADRSALTEPQVKYVHHIADPDRNARLTRNELPTALTAFRALRSDLNATGRAFASFDTNSSGALEPAQLAAVLQQINKGVDVSSEELDWVMRHADADHNAAIDIHELSSAVALFYLHITKQREQHQAAKDSTRWYCRVPKQSEFPGALNDDAAPA